MSKGIPREELKRLLLRATDPSVGDDARLDTCEEIGCLFPPEECSGAYGDLLFEPDIGLETKLLVVGILYLVRDDPAALALAEAIKAEDLHAWVRIQATRRLVRINAELAREAARNGAPWLLPLIESEITHPSPHEEDDEDARRYHFALAWPKKLFAIKGGDA